MKPTVKSFLALAEDKEQTVHIARFKSDSADGYKMKAGKAHGFNRGMKGRQQ